MASTVHLHPRVDKRRFLNLATGALACVSSLPLLMDCRVLDSVDGLLVLYKANATTLLLHPFTGDIVKLPPLHWNLLDVVGGRYDDSVQPKFVATLSVSADGVIIVMIVHQYIRRVFFATSKDRQWRVSNWSLSPLSIPI
ncbi:hypothetical protein D1007_12747 [Hordeum vulgare]|nr:hypothetical protein D1007_12747 [Hordeum vulgare]